MREIWWAVISEEMNKGCQWGRGGYLGLTERRKATRRSLGIIFRTFSLHENISVS